MTHEDIWARYVSGMQQGMEFARQLGGISGMRRRGRLGLAKAGPFVRERTREPRNQWLDLRPGAYVLTHPALKHNDGVPCPEFTHMKSVVADLDHPVRVAGRAGHGAAQRNQRNRSEER